MTNYKAFDANFSCRGFKFESGKVYREENISVCERGFHSCKLPLDVLSYYPPTSRFAVVEASGEIQRQTGEDSKVCSSELKVVKEIGLVELINAQVKKVREGKSHAATTGDYAHAATTGNSAHAATTGYYARAATTGNSAHAATTGDYAHAATTGEYAYAATTRYSARAATTGNYAHAATTGKSARAATTGDFAHAATTGKYAHAATTGSYARAATTGYNAHAATTGDFALASTAQPNTIAASLGKNSCAKGVVGGWLILVEHNGDSIVGGQVLKIDGNKIKENVFYKLKDGMVVEC